MESVICFICAAICLMISIFQFCEKGFVFNNAYLYASKQERERMDKKPHYRQSAIVFALLTGVFMCIGLSETFKLNWLMAAGVIAEVAVVVYAVWSSITASMKKKK